MLAWNAGNRVVTTDQEHPGGRVCWGDVVRQHGVAHEIVPIPSGEHGAQATVDRFKKAITPRTRVLSHSHILSSIGLLMPVHELSEIARSHRGSEVVSTSAGALASALLTFQLPDAHQSRSSRRFNPAAAANVMCRNTLSVGWDGTLYDCDFNKMLDLPVHANAPQTIFNWDYTTLDGRDIVLDAHCFGCTAGAGSSCGGATSVPASPIHQETGSA